LEASLKVALVRRMPSGVRLTEHGAQLARLAQPHVAGLADAIDAVGKAEEQLVGTLRISAPPDLGQLALPPLLTGLLTRHPHLRVDVDVSVHLVDVAGEGYDAALRFSANRDKGQSLLSKRLASAPGHLYASPQYLARHAAPKSLAELAQHEHVLFRGKNGRGKLKLRGDDGATSLSVSGRFSANDFVVVREAVLGGAGIGPVPWFVARAAAQAGALQRVLPGYEDTGVPLCFVHPAQRPTPRKVEALRDYLVEHMPEVLKPPSG
jgi:DNA-binding transcriptional LysR family regulator